MFFNNKIDYNQNNSLSSQHYAKSKLSLVTYTFQIFLYTKYTNMNPKSMQN